MKKERITKILYAFASLGYFIYMVTRKSEFMFFGGLFLIAASIMLIICNKNKK